MESDASGGIGVGQERLVVEEWFVPNSRLVTNANTAAEWAVVETFVETGG